MSQNSVLVFVRLLVLVSLAAAPATARAAPRHDVCADLEGQLGLGISSYSSAGDWAERAHDAGADWRTLYVYLVPPGDEIDGYRWFIGEKVRIAESIAAIPFFSVYLLVPLGQAAGFGGDEGAIVEAVLADAGLMRTYFDTVQVILDTLGGLGATAVVHMEPDPWGFMMWSMGVEGNDDPHTISVQVAGSGHPDLAAFPDDAAGFAQALLALRDLYAPAVRMGWHASNFRAGTRPEVVTTFYSRLGAEFDVVVSEHPHNEANEATWWEPWDETRVQTNLDWMRAVSTGAGVPLILWQLPIGTSDWHLLGDWPADTTMLERFAEAGVVELVFEHNVQGDADAFRADRGQLGAVPPADSPAGGTAADLRTRVLAYSAAPLPLPPEATCGVVVGADGDADADADTDADADADTDSDADTDADTDTDTDADGEGGRRRVGAEGSCNCRLDGAGRPGGALSLLALLLPWVRRRRG